MDPLQLLWLLLLLNAMCWLGIIKILKRGWLRRIRNLTTRRVVAVTATVFALLTVIIWAVAAFCKRFWDVMIFPAVQEYARLTGIRKEDA